MLFCSLLLQFWLWPAPSSADNCPKHYELARSFVGMTEGVGNNRGKWIDYWCTKYGLPLGSNWCALFQMAMIDSAGGILPPGPRSRLAVAKAWKTKKSHSAKDVLLGRWDPPCGTYVGWTYGSSWRGHGGQVESWDGVSGWSIDGNTTSGAGNQRDGQGVHRRRRTIRLRDHFRIDFFTPIEYPDEHTTLHRGDTAVSPRHATSEAVQPASGGFISLSSGRLPGYGENRHDTGGGRAESAGVSSGEYPPVNERDNHPPDSHSTTVDRFGLSGRGDDRQYRSSRASRRSQRIESA